MRNSIYLTFFLLNIFFFLSCYKESDFSATKIAASDTALHVYIEPSSIPADSFSLSRIVVEMPYNADTSKASVTIRTNLGIFLESGNNSFTVTAKNNIDSSKKIATATLKSGTQVGTAIITVYFYASTQYLTDSFYNSYPSFMNLTASTINLKPANDGTGEVSFTCKIYKNFGSVSIRNKVSMQVVDSNGIALGLFRLYNNLSDPTSSTQFTFVLGDSLINGRNYYGRMFAIATTAVDSLGSTLSDTINLFSIH